MEIITEGAAKIKITKQEKISKDMGVFYNPVMSLNRDISVLLLNSINKKKLQIADPLAASGIRGIRFLKELREGKIKKIYINDYEKSAVKSIRENLKLNKIQENGKIIITNRDANLLLLDSFGFDYIDVDPFGTPNPFLDSACKRLSRDGILAITATDTSALCGTFPKACIRKYWARPKKGPIMHETGLRILIRKVQLIGAQYDKALVPIFSYSKEHYMRVFLRNDKGKNKVDEVLAMHGNFNGAGPLWLGALFDEKLCGLIYKNSLKDRLLKNNAELVRFLKIIREESKLSIVGFYDLNKMHEENKIASMDKKSNITKRIISLGYKACDTHFKGEGLRSNIHYKKLLSIIKKE